MVTWKMWLGGVTRQLQGQQQQQCVVVVVVVVRRATPLDLGVSGETRLGSEGRGWGVRVREMPETEAERVRRRRSVRD